MRRNWLVLGLMLSAAGSRAQDNGLVNSSESKFARLKPVPMQAVKWTKGFWADKFQVARDSMVPNMWAIYNDPNISHAFKNFEIAAGLDTGSHKGPSFHDGDFYKTLEAVASMYASTRDPKLNSWMDHAIDVIGKTQRADGYIYTKAAIEQKQTGAQTQFEDRLSFEAYNIGHLMTAAAVHYRATGKTSLLNIARRATDYLYNFYKKASPTLARNAICPSHYMGVVEMYRTVHDPRYLELANHLIDIKGRIDDGTDDNQDRVPFRDQDHATGHAVRANYLYAGVADLYAETGDTNLLNRLMLMWDDVTQHKMYITGGCGSLYDGVSPDGTVYNPTYVQKIHQAYGRPYQLPNLTAHNETCANIGNVLWNYRMLLATGDARFADVMELALYNSVLSGISLNGKNFLYTNPLAYSDDLPFAQRWSKDRVPYISLSDCCPPNVVRTIAEVSNYAYNISPKAVWVNLYGGSTLNENGVRIEQVTDYPWNGAIRIKLYSLPSGDTLFLRYPGWAESASVKINGVPAKFTNKPGSYIDLVRAWKAGDVVELNFPMPVERMVANPLVEETRGQVALKRGPVVYCAESPDLPSGFSVGQIELSEAPFSILPLTIGKERVMSLNTTVAFDQSNWDGTLYQTKKAAPVKKSVRFIPYYAWGNRGHSEMSVWLK